MSNADWKSKLTFLAPEATPVEIGGQMINFYPISGRLLFKLKTVARPLANALAVLFSNKTSEQGSTQRNFTIPGRVENGLAIPEERGGEVMINPVSVDLYEARQKQREIAINNLVDAFSKPENQLLLVELIFDSCRDIFPRRPESAQLDEFLGDIDTAALASMLKGVAKANAKVFGPLGGRVSAALARKLETLENEDGAMDDEQDESDPTGETTSSIPSTASPTASPAPQPRPVPAAPPFPVPPATPTPPTPTPSPGS